VICPNCLTVIPVATPDNSAPKADPLIGQRLREFKILDLLGRGGMGAV